VEKVLAFRAADEVGPRDDDEVGPVQSPSRFAQQAARQLSAMTPGVRGIDQDDVEIAFQASVLEAVIQNNDVHGQGGQVAGGTGPVAVLKMRDAGTQEIKDPFLVVPGGIEGAIAPAGDSRVQPASLERLDDRGNDRSLSRPPGGQVADPDDRDAR
jgi:hypothetical protein